MRERAGQHTRDVEILMIRMLWNNGLTLQQAWGRLQVRMPQVAKATLVNEWRQLHRQFGCKSLPLAYLYGWRNSRGWVPTPQELSAVVGNTRGGRTYGDWLGLAGPGLRLREMLAVEKQADGSETGHESGSA